jgi:valyl-tRNA synthetase
MLSRHDIGREKFLEQAWDWKEEYASFIRKQWAKLGLGCTSLRIPVDYTFASINNTFVIKINKYFFNSFT